jgi:hypothetical protein
LYQKNKLDSENTATQRYERYLDQLSTVAFIIVSTHEEYLKIGKPKAKIIITN